MVAGSFTRELVCAVSPDRLWKAGAHEGHDLFPNLLPDLVSSVEVIEGDGQSGYVKKYNFTEVVKVFGFRTEKFDELDNEKHHVKLTVLEGGLLGKRCKSYATYIDLEAVNSIGTLTKIKAEYDTINETPLSVEEEDESVKDLLLTIKALEAYLIANPTSEA